MTAPSARLARRDGLALLWWRALALVAAASLGVELFNFARGGPLFGPEMGLGGRLLRYFSFFTIQSNLLVLAATLPLARDPRHDGPLWRVVRLSSLLGITVTGLVFAVVLAAIYRPTGLAWWTNLGLHYAVPVLAVLGWALLGPFGRITWGTVAWAVVWPVAWTLFTLAQGALTGWYPYGFLDVGKLGYGGALRNLAVITAMSLLFLALFRAGDRGLARAAAAPGRAEG
jgi:lysylphosphatidylglycerol synthetase-like protein (DUF2156 family)